MQSLHLANRERFLKLLADEGAAALIFSGSVQVRNADTEYAFRPQSDFFYLTGFTEPEAALLLLPNGPGGKSGSTILYLRDKNPEQEVWTGRRLGCEAAPEALGVDEACSIDDLWNDVADRLEGHRRLVYATGIDSERDRCVLDTLDDCRSKSRRGGQYPSELVDPLETLHELRLVKSEDEVECMRRAASISCEAHNAVMRAAKPGMNEAELAGLLEYTFKRRGCTGVAYESIVAGGENACILHYVENNTPLVDGDLCLVDAGGEWNHYASDITRTFPINGTFSEEQRALYEVVLRAQLAGIREVRPGGTTDSIHGAALAELVDGLLELGLLSGDREQVLTEGSYRRFYMHRTGHWLGLDVHDCGSQHRDGASRPLVPGMVQTVEPGLYVAPDDDTVEARWRGIGIRIEDDVLVTEDGHEILSAEVPKSVDEVEALCRSAELQTS